MVSTLPILFAGLILGAIALLSVWTGQALLAPSLGSALFTQLLSPRSPTAKPYKVGVGQVIGLLCGMAAVHLVGAVETPPFMTGHALLPIRVLAVVVAVVAASGLQQVFKATNAAGGTTALVVALGMETADWSGAGRLLCGIVLVTAFGEVARRILIGWTPEPPEKTPSS